MSPRRSGVERVGRVRGLGTEGDGAVELDDGAVVLVRGVLPGERVRIEEIGRGRVRRGVLRAVLEPSADRVAPPCALADACGGCPLMHGSAGVQAVVKRERVQRALAPYVPADAVTLDTPRASLAYRTRARLAWAAPALGYRAEASRRVVDVTACAVLGPRAREALDLVRRQLLPLLAGEGEIRIGAAAARPTLALESRSAQAPALYQALDAMVREGAVLGASLLAGGATAKARFGAVHDETTDVEGRRLHAPLGGFGQAHADHNRALGAFAIGAAAADGARVVELFAGHGNFTLALAARAERVHAIELDPDATECLRINLEAHGLRARVERGDAGALAAALPRGTVDVVLLDPPREGAAQVMAPLVSLAAVRVVYVSCHPESLARDVGMLVAGGYHVSAVRAFDMFPQTAHVEVVVALERSGVAARAPGR